MVRVPELAGAPLGVDTPDVPDWRAMQCHLDRLDLSAETPSFLGWSGYTGTHHDARYRPSGVVE